MGGRGRDRRIPEFKDSLVYKEKPCLGEKEEGRKEEREGGREMKWFLCPSFSYNSQSFKDASKHGYQ